MTLPKLQEATAAGFAILAEQIAAMAEIPGAADRAKALRTLVEIMAPPAAPARPDCLNCFKPGREMVFHPQDRTDCCPRCGEPLVKFTPP